MPDLSFQVEGAEPLPFAEAPLLIFKLRVTNRPAEEVIHSIMLRCQIQIETTRRRYEPQEQAQLFDLFGEPERWRQTLRSMLWTFSHVTVPPFADRTLVDLPVPCTFDFNVAATKYFYALAEGEVPLTLLFSGTVFYKAESGHLQVAQISWETEATYRLPVQVWQAMMDHYYPNSVWLRLPRDLFDQLYEYRLRWGLPTWEKALERLLAEQKERER